MKKVLFILLLFLPFLNNAQEFIDDSNFDDKINEQSAFGDDESTIVVIEFWAKFNEANAFADWNKLEGVKYYRVDIGAAPAAKKEYRVRMAPTILIFKNGSVEESFKAGLDLLLPTDLNEIQESINEINNANKF